MRHPARLPLEQLQPYLLELPAEVGPLDFRTVFGNDHRVTMEVGFGKGLFLLSAAQAQPEVNFLGIEVERKYQLFTATRVAKRALANVRLACADARALVRDRLAEASLEAAHVYFPDPWWKTRHHKRRLFTADFTAQLQRVVRPGGMLHLASDVEEYWRIITDLVRQRLGFVPLPAGDADVLTNFARKYRAEGRAIYQASYRRVALPT